MQRINRASWRIIETILLRYPQRKKEYEEYISDIMASSVGGSSHYSNLNRENEEKPQSVTEAKALKMTTVYFERIKKEVESIELVYNDLCKEEQDVIRTRYWSSGIRKPVPYYRLAACSYSDRQMQRIVQKVVIRVGKYIGEIR